MPATAMTENWGGGVDQLDLEPFVFPKVNHAKFRNNVLMLKKFSWMEYS
jgi:hypothetical protein